MSWAAITEADLLTRISGSELTAYRAAALGAGQVDPVTPAIDQVTDLVRGYIAACAENTLGTDGTIPSKLLGPALDLLVVEVIKRVPGIVIDDARLEAKRDAIKLLEQVAACKFRIEEPATATTETHPGQTPTYSEDRTAQYKRSHQDGL